VCSSDLAILRQGTIAELGKDEKHRQLMVQNFTGMRKLIQP
jgi:hypothetical protein